MSSESIPPIPNEFRILSMMHNIGAVTPDRSLTAEDLARWTEHDLSTIQDCLDRLRELGYVELIQSEGIGKYHVTKIGMMKVLSLYS